MIQRYLLTVLTWTLLTLSLQAQTVWNGPAIVFNKPAYANPSIPENQDRITDSTWITRGYTQGLYNAFSETSYQQSPSEYDPESSPENTEWARGTLEDYASLTYQSWREWVRSCPPCRIGESAVVHLIKEDIYIGITYRGWGIGEGGAFSYLRTTAGAPGLKTFYRDADGDGYGNYTEYKIAETRPTGYIADFSDCNDSRSSVYPGAREICDGLDNDCDGLVDVGYFPIVSGITLVNADTDEDLREVKEGDVVDLSTIPTKNLDIRVNTSPDTINYVRLELQGPRAVKRTEYHLPYSLLGDDQGDYNVGSLPLGDYTLTATPFCSAAGRPLTIHFKIYNSAAPSTVIGFAVVDASTKQEVRELKDGDTLDLSTVLGPNLNIRAHVTPSRIGSMKLELRGAQGHKWTENGPPYMLFGDRNGNIHGRALPAGEYTLTAIPFMGKDSRGERGNPLTIRFHVVNKAVVSSFTLVNATTGKDIRELKPGAVINLATLPSRELNIRANTTPGVVGSVVFDLTGAESRQHTENRLPYSVFANNQLAYKPWTPTIGGYSLIATPYSSAWSSGAVGDSRALPFSVIDNSDGSGCTSLNFVPANTNLGSDDIAQGLATGDFNSDGLADLAFSNWITLTLDVLLSKGDGTFTKAGKYPTDYTYSITNGDFNGDGKLDIAVTMANNTIGNNIAVLLNKGDGSFEKAVFYPIINVGNIAAGDFNGDGKPDLVTGDYNSTTISVLLNKGNGSFEKAITYSDGLAYFIGAIATADFNADGKLDLAVTYLYAFLEVTFAVLLNKGDGSFEKAVNYSNNSQIQGSNFIAPGDFNGDSKPDLVIGAAGSSIAVLLNKGDGNFAPAINSFLGSVYGPNGVVISDFNKDEILDLALATGSFGAGGISIMMGKGDGSFAPVAFYERSEPYSIAGGDFNGDGNQDIAHGYFNNPIAVLLSSCETAAPQVVHPTTQRFLHAAPEQKVTGLLASPNPFSTQTTVRFSVDKTSYTTIGVYNLQGVEVRRLFQGKIEGGQSYQASLKAGSLSSGVYILQLITQGKAERYKVVLIR